MADMIVDGAKLDACLDAEADAIRAKTGGSADIPFDFANNKGFADAIASIQTGGGSQNTKITIVSATTKTNEFLALLPSGHENEGFTATALNKPQSGYYLASISGKVTPGNDNFAIMRSADVSTSQPTVTTGQAWGAAPTQAGMEYEVIFYAL